MKKKALDIRDKTVFDGVLVKYMLKHFFRMWFKLCGWQTTKSIPEGVGITIAAPHTSNWDFFYALGAAILLDIKIYFSIKDSWCHMPILGSVIMWLGAIPIDRSSDAQGQVDKIKKFVERKKKGRVFFIFTPEGTRGKVTKWRTGFYHFAQQCDLPIFLGKVDYCTKESGVFHMYQITGNITEDIRNIQESYKCVQGKFPTNQFPQYVGPGPEISRVEALIMRAVDSFQRAASRIEIAGKSKISEITTMNLDFLIKKGVLEKVDNGPDEPTYQLTFSGKGCLLHLFPTLAM